MRGKQYMQSVQSMQRTQSIQPTQYKQNMQYNGGLTAEKFLFYEMRIVAKLYIQGKSAEEIIEHVKKDNLFQYPTERLVSRLARACYRRLEAIDNTKLANELLRLQTRLQSRSTCML